MSLRLEALYLSLQVRWLLQCSLFDTARIVCLAGSMKWSSIRLVRPSVCPIDPQQQWRVAGLLLSTPRSGDIDQ